MLGIQGAEHEETSPQASTLVISRLSCSLVGVTGKIIITPGTLAHRIYGRGEVIEEFRCNYGVNPAYRETLGGGDLKIVGVDPAGEVRIVELSGHRFFVATLSVPQHSSLPDLPHPLIVAFLKAAMAFQPSRPGIAGTPPGVG